MSVRNEQQRHNKSVFEASQYLDLYSNDSSNVVEMKPFLRPVGRTRTENNFADDDEA